MSDPTRCPACGEPVDNHVDAVAPGVVWIDGIGYVEPCSAFADEESFESNPARVALAPVRKLASKGPDYEDAILARDEADESWWT